MSSLKLIGIDCYVPEEAGLDEVYLKLEGKRIWPQSQSYEQLPIGHTELNLDLGERQRGSTIEIECWDFDSLSFNDKMGTFKLMLDTSGRFETEMKKHAKTKASYSLTWEYY